MVAFEIPLFPHDSLAISVTTTVWIGVWVVAFFNLRFGWTLSGLVVPGFLVPLLFMKPEAVAIILVEAILTYAIVYLVSEKPRELPYWCSFFGRDRFFALVLVSILVRCLVDGWLIPWAGPKVNELYGLNLDYRNDLHSYGLIVVALLANYFWKPGLRRGLTETCTTVSLTYLLVRYGLVEFTNFNVGNLEYMYADVSSSLLASPKAYMIIVATGYLASWTNLRYGWDFNGILIPALLGLLWHTPEKIVTTLAEAVVILLLGKLLLKLPLWRRMTIEGARKTLLFFSICYLNRLLLSHLLPQIWPSVQITDAFGFGYLLSSLMAIKAHDKAIPFRLAKGTLQISMLGSVVGTSLGFLISLIPQTWFLSSVRAETSQATVMVSDGQLNDLIRADKILLYQKRVPESYQAPLPSELAEFAAGIRRLTEYAVTREDSVLEVATRRLFHANYRVQLVEGRYLHLREMAPARGWGIFVFDLEHPDGLNVQVPAPLDEWGTLESGLCFFNGLDSATLAISGTDSQTNRDGSADVLLRRNTIFAAFQRATSRTNTLQVRGHTGSSWRLVGASPDESSAADTLESSLWVRRSLPESLNLARVKQLIHRVDMQWGDTPRRNQLRDATTTGFAELILSRADRQALLSRLVVGHADVSPLPIHHGPLQQKLSSIKHGIAAQGSNAYVPASLEEMMFLDEEVVQTVVDLATSVDTFESLDPDDWRRLRVAAASCTALGYDLTLLRDQHGQAEFFILEEIEPRQRHWGTFIFRCGMKQPYVVHAPRPLFERRSFDFAGSLFQRSRCAALFIAGAHPRANPDGSADLARLTNKVNAFNLVNQVLLREAGDRPLLVIQARAIQAPVRADVVVATHGGAIREEELPDLQRELLRRIRQDGISMKFVDGSYETAGYELGILLQASSVNSSENKQIISLWLSPALRTRYRRAEDDRLLESQFQVAGIETIVCSLHEFLGNLPTVTASADAFPNGLAEEVRSFLENHDVVRLWKLGRDWSEWRFVHIVDQDTDQHLLVITDAASALIRVYNVSGSVDFGSDVTVVHQADPTAIREFVESRSWALEIRRAP